MSQKTIMLVCSAGMSTSILVKKIEEEAASKNLDRSVFAVSTTEADENIDKGNIDVLLLGPQVRFQKESYEEKAQSVGTKIAVIPMTDYGTMNGENVLELAESLMTE